jgi:putative colanic acid biosynthesis UDP-glucose lipid carrier transferase
LRRSLLKDNAQFFEWAMRLLDPLLLALVGALAFVLYLDDPALRERYTYAIVGMSLVCATIFPFVGLYAPQRGVTLFEEIRLLVNAWLLLATVWFAFLFLSKSGSNFSRIWSIYWIVAGFLVHALVRSTIRFTLRALRRRGYNLRRIAIIGAGDLGCEIARRIDRMPWSGLVIRAFYDDNDALHGKTCEGAPVVGSVDRLVDDLDAGAIDQIWIALPLRAEARIRDLLVRLRRYSVQVRFVPDIFNFALLRHSMTEIAGLPVINLTESPLEGPGLLLKKLEDFFVSLTVLILALPLMLAIAIGIKLTSPGPIFYRQERVTWNGERFRILKFRTMPSDVEAAGPLWSNESEGRATRFGAFLRRTSLDELPQFVNVLRGEMSVVGPRPERPEFVERFKHEIPGYMQKHLVKAGITGWAQVNDFRGDSDLHERIQYDLYYIENWSLWFDLRIIALTLVHVFRSRNAR